MRPTITTSPIVLLALIAACSGDRMPTDPPTAIRNGPLEPRFSIASSGFSEDFSSSTLDPAWTVVPGARYYYPGFGLPVNDYSLTANPGHLRYTLNPMSHPHGFLNGYAAAPPPQLNAIYGYDPGLEIYRSISGEHWLLEAKGTFYLPCANGRSLNIYVYFGPGGPGTTAAGWVRHRDTPIGCTVGGSSLGASIVRQPGTTAGDLLYEGAGVSLPIADPALSTYYLRLERAGGLLTWSSSANGTSWTVMFSKDFGTALDGLDQRVTIVGHSWFVPASSYGDWDYVNVTPTTVPDLTVDKSHSGNFTFGSNGSYLIRVSNVGTGPTDGTITVTDELDPLLAYVSASGTDWSCGASGSTVSCTRTAPIAEGSYSDITLTVQPNGAGSLANTASVAGGGETDESNNSDEDPTTIDPAPTTSVVSVPTVSPQYSDKVTLRATVAPDQIETSEVTGTVFFYVGAAAVTCTASPAVGSVGDDAIAADDDGVAEILYDISDATGSYTVTGCFYSSNDDYDDSGDTETLAVGGEDATVIPGVGNGNAYAVASAGGTASFTLTFVVRETNTEPDQNDGALPGDVDNAGLTVQLQGVGSSTHNETLACAAGGSIATPPAYSDTRTFTCAFGAVAVDAYEVVAQVTGNHYVGAYGDAITVYDPSLGFVTGGGRFTYPDSDDRVSFGLSFTYIGKDKKTPRGNLVVVRHHADGSRCRAKSNAIGAPAVSGNTASFSGKGNYTCLDALGNTLPGGQGNLNLFGYVEDNGEPGIGADKFWVRVYGELLMSKSPSAAANAAVLTGGNVQVPKP